MHRMLQVDLCFSNGCVGWLMSGRQKFTLVWCKPFMNVLYGNSCGRGRMGSAAVKAVEMLKLLLHRDMYVVLNYVC